MIWIFSLRSHFTGVINGTTLLLFYLICVIILVAFFEFLFVILNEKFRLVSFCVLSVSLIAVQFLLELAFFI